MTNSLGLAKPLPSWWRIHPPCLHQTLQDLRVAHRILALITSGPQRNHLLTIQGVASSKVQVPEGSRLSQALVLNPRCCPYHLAGTAALGPNWGTQTVTRAHGRSRQTLCFTNPSILGLGQDTPRGTPRIFLTFAKALAILHGFLESRPPAPVDDLQVYN